MPKRNPDSEFIARICLIANRAKQEQFGDVASWMQRHLSADINLERTRRSTRKRGVHVRLLGGRVKAVLDERQVRALTEREE